MWLGFQLLALLVPVLRIPLAAGYPRPAELTAASLMGAVQVTAAALLAPFLLRTWHSTLSAVATAWPFIVLAGVVSGLPMARTTVAAAYVSVWLAALWVLISFSPSRALRQGLTAAATVLTVGTLALFYLRLEFVPDAATDPARLATTLSRASPPMAVLGLLGEPQSAQIWCLPMACIALALACRFIARRSRHVIHKSSTF